MKKAVKYFSSFTISILKILFFTIFFITTNEKCPFGFNVLRVLCDTNVIFYSHKRPWNFIFDMNFNLMFLFVLEKEYWLIYRWTDTYKRLRITISIKCSNSQPVED